MTEKTVTVEVDPARCVSSGNCADVAPRVFTQDDETGVVVLLDAAPGGSQRDAVRLAETLCPARAIRVRALP